MTCRGRGRKGEKGVTQEIDAAMEMKETESAWGTRSWGQ